jgi:hypothetical protein
LDYVGPIPDNLYFGVDGMSEGEKSISSHGLMSRKIVFNCRRVLEKHCQYDFPVLRQACRIFRWVLMEIENIDVFLEAVTTTSACYKVFRKKFLKPETIGLIPTGCYTANSRYSKKALMWLLHMEQMDGCHIQHSRNERE